MKFRNKTIGIFTLFIFLLNGKALSFDLNRSEFTLKTVFKFTKDIKRSVSILDDGHFLNDSDFTKLLKQEITDCGVKTIGDSCFNSKFSSRHAHKSYRIKDQKGYRYFLKGLSPKGYEYFNSLQVVKAHAEGMNLIVDQVYYFEVNSNEDFDQLFERLIVEEDEYPLFSATVISQKDFDLNLSQFFKSKTPRELVHRLDILLNIKDKKGLQDKTIKNAALSKKELFKSLKMMKYQFHTLNLLDKKGDFPIEEMFSYLAKSFLKGRDPIRRFAGISLAKRGQKSPEIRSAVVEALQDKDPVIQKNAVEALYKIREGLKDELLILGMLRSTETEVALKSFQLLLQLELGKEIYFYLKRMAEDKDNEKAQARALSLIAKVEIPEARSYLFSLLTKRPRDRAAHVHKTLMGDKLTKNDWPLVLDLLNSRKKRHKLMALPLINKFDTPEVSFLLISVFANGKSKMREEAYKILSNRKFSKEGLEKKKLLPLLNSRKEERVFQVAKLLTKIPGEDVSISLLRLVRTFEEEQGKQVLALVLRRKFVGGETLELGRLLNHPSPLFRLYAAKLFVKLPGQKTLSILKKRLSREGEKTIQEALKTVISKIERKLSGENENDSEDSEDEEE